MADTWEEGKPCARADSRLVVPVPWDRAEAIHARLAKRGIRAVACYDPRYREASIELCQDTDLDGIRDIIQGDGK